MINQPIYNPPNPYCGLVPEGSLQPNLLIKINGRVRPGANQFAINLQLGPRVNPRDDLALHLSPVFTHPQRVVRNNLQSLNWGPEESSGGMPFQQGGQFEIIILVEYGGYKIAINGYHFTEFIHRLPYNHVSHLSIDGDVDISSILYELLQSGSTQQRPQTTSAPLPPYPTSGGVSSGMPPYPMAGNQSGGFVNPPMPQMPFTSGGYTQAGYQQPYHQQQSYPVGNQGYPMLPGMAPQQAYPSVSGAYGGAPPGYVNKPKKNKGILGGGILPIAGAIGGTMIGASLLSRAVPKMKMFKGPKFFKHKGFKHKGFGFGGGGFMGKSKGFGKFKGPKFGKFKGPKW